MHKPLPFGANRIHSDNSFLEEFKGTVAHLAVRGLLQSLHICKMAVKRSFFLN